MAGGVVIGLTDRERVMHAANLKKMAESMIIVSESLENPERDMETLVGLVMIGMQAGNVEQLLKAVQATTGISDLPNDASGAEDPT